MTLTEINWIVHRLQIALACHGTRLDDFCDRDAEALFRHFSSRIVRIRGVLNASAAFHWLDRQAERCKWD